ncbi:MAG TPA: TonB-dependent receptor [Candidatus Binataceae bacterium]|nr:TonB-dependent receptor [Candidatus Binataceae bacterium]
MYVRSSFHALVFLTVMLVGPLPVAATSQAPKSRGLKLEGVVLDSLSRPVAGATVVLRSAGKSLARTSTDSKGAFRFGAPSFGNYVVTISKPGFKRAQQSLRIDQGQPTPISITLESAKPLDLPVLAERLNHARNDLSPETGSTAYSFNTEAIHRLPQGSNTALSQVLVQAPGVSQDAYGQGQEQIHIHGENGGGIQYRLNNVFLPEAVSSFGELLSPRFVDKITLLTGVLPSNFGFRNEGVIDIHTKDGCLNGGGSAEMYGGQRGTLQPSFEYGGCQGNFSYFVSGYYLQSNLGLQSPTSSPDPNHDFTQQGQGFSYISYYLNPYTRISLLAGTSINSFQIPPEPGLAPVYQLEGVTNYPSAWVKDTQLEQNYYQILSLQGMLDPKIDYQLAAFTRYYALSYYPDHVGDLIYDGVAAQIFHSGLINGTQGDVAYRFNSTHTFRGGFYLSGENIEIDDHAATFPANDGTQTSNIPVNIVDNHNQVAWLVGFYGQDEWRPLPRLVLNIGLRWDWMSAFVVQNQWSPRFGFTYQLFPSTVLHGGYARYFKVPPFESVLLETVNTFKNTTNAPDVTSGNDKIPAETDDYFDLGVRQNITEGLNVGLDGFFNYAHDQLDLAQLAGTQVFAPLSYSHSRAWGSDFSLTYQHAKAAAYFNFSYAVLQAKKIVAGQFLADDAAEAAYISDHWVTLDDNQMFTASAGVSEEILGFLLTTDSIWGSGYRRGFANSGELPPSLQVNAAVVRSIALPRLGEAQVRVAVVNLFDHSYQIRNGTGIGVFSPQYAPRRALYAGLRIPLAFSP